MKYISTRGNAPAKTFTEILLGGLAPMAVCICLKNILSESRRTGCLAQSVLCRSGV